MNGKLYPVALGEMRVHELLTRGSEWVSVATQRQKINDSIPIRDKDFEESWGMLARAMTVADFLATDFSGVRGTKKEIETVLTCRRQVTVLVMHCLNRLVELGESSRSQTILGFWKQHRDTFDQSDLIATMAYRLFFSIERSIPFMSSKGEFGMVRPTAQRGDELWYIFGCSTVLVLRPHQDGYYQLVGDAYLEGYNLGELYSDLADDSQVGEKVRDFTIERIVLH